VHDANLQAACTAHLEHSVLQHLDRAEALSPVQPWFLLQAAVPTSALISPCAPRLQLALVLPGSSPLPGGDEASHALSDLRLCHLHQQYRICYCLRVVHKTVRLSRDPVHVLFCLSGSRAQACAWGYIKGRANCPLKIYLKLGVCKLLVPPEVLCK
jgi:hypothetical protein